MIQYEIGHLTQHALANEPQAVREYLQAYNLDPQFRPPLIALVQIFERRRSIKNLLRLYDAEARSATTPREAASALADRAVLMADAHGEADEARPLLETAFRQAAEATDIALLLEYDLLSRGETEAALEIIQARADLVRDPVLATLLRIEIARAKEAAGDVDGALSMLRVALGTPAARWRVLSELERVARKAGRTAELALALEGRARLAAAVAGGEDAGQGSGAFSVQRFATRERAGEVAAALFRDAGRLRARKLSDAQGAQDDYDEALALRADDPLLRFERMLAYELAGDLDGAATEAEKLLEAGATGPMAAALHFRVAERAQVGGDTDGALTALKAGLEADPESAVIGAMLDDLVRGLGDFRTAHDQLVASAESLEGDAKADKLWEAADLATRRLADTQAASQSFESAAAASAAPEAIHREAFASALQLGDPVGAQKHAEALLGQEIDPAERSALLRDMYELVRLVLQDEGAADTALLRALDSPEASAWAPDLSRVNAAVRDQAELLARAHHALAARAGDAETAAAHLCAAARTEARAGNADAAVESLRGALERSPTHPYAAALLEEVLRARGDAEQVVRLLREAAEKADAPRAAETRLLLAGAAAEAADDVDRAVQAYDEAASRNPFSLAPVLALRRLAEGRGDAELLLRSLTELSRREIASGEPGRHTLALGEHLDLMSGLPEQAEEPLRAALAGESVALPAAVDLALLPIAGGDAARLAGLERLLDHASAEAKPGMLREAAGAALAIRDVEKAAALLDQLQELAPNDRWATFGRLRLAALAPDRKGDRAEAWLTLGRATDDPEVAAEIVLHGLRTRASSEGDDDDDVILAHELRELAPNALPSAIALHESLSAGDDPESRADALSSWLEHAGDTGHTSLELAVGRALAAAGRPREALEVLLRVAARDPDDLASWETIRICARDCEAWAPLVEACDRMAHIVDDDELKMLLWEESSAVLMDALEQDARAERRLRRVLAIDARRPIAYGRLHDLLADRGDDAGLLELVSNRIELVDDPAELGKLFYEQARLLRSLGLGEEALLALDNLLMLESSHVGGLALLVELQVQGENWAGAVEALQTLAAADDVPGSQRRIARLGAADFMENKLGDVEGALAELTALHEAELADLEIYQRMVSAAQQLERHDDAILALENAVTHAPSAAVVARLERRAAAIHTEHRLDREGAIAAYSRALVAVPLDLTSAEALADLLDEAERTEMSRAFEATVRGALQQAPGEPRLLRMLGRAAAWRGDQGLERASLDILVTLGLALDDELAVFEAMRRPTTPRGAMDEAMLAALQLPGLSAPPLRLAMAIGESAAEMDGLEPSGFGLGRGDHVKGSSPLKTELAALSGMFGLSPPELYAGGSEPARIDLAPHYKGSPTWITGPAIQGPLSSDQRFTVGWLAVGARLGVTPFVRRGPFGAAIALFAAAEAAEVPLAAGQGRASMAETKRRIYKAMPRRVRKSLPAIVGSLGDGRTVDAWALDLARTAQRAGMLAANDPLTALRRVLSSEPTPELIMESAEALDLIFFWLSPECIALRQRLGLSA